MEDRPSRFWDAFWVVVPLILGAVLGAYLAGQITAGPLTCDQPAALPTSANFVLGVVLVILLVGRVVGRRVIGPVAGRAFNIAILALLVSACGSYFIRTPEQACPPTALASAHEALVRTAPAQLHLSRYVA